MRKKQLTRATKNAPPRPEYETCFDQEIQKIMPVHGQDDLFAEIELIRYMNLVTLKRMKAEGKKMPYRDHLATLRAVTLAAGEIAYLAGMQNKLFSPLTKMENKYKQEMENTYGRLVEIAEMLMGKEKVGEIQTADYIQILRDASRKKVV